MPKIVKKVERLLQDSGANSTKQTKRHLPICKCQVLSTDLINALYEIFDNINLMKFRINLFFRTLRTFHSKKGIVL